jgi:argininosuccinate lyase
VPFREAHEAVGHLVVWCVVYECDLGEVGDDDLAKISPHLGPEIRDVLSVTGALRARRAHGGTAPERVAEQLAAARHEIAAHRAWAGEVGEEP